MKTRAILAMVVAAAAILVMAAGVHSDRRSRVSIVDSDEPGDPLMLTGVVVTEDGSLVQGAIVKMHHADAGGVYNASRVLPARLRGTMTTDSRGRFELRTVRPGSYPGTTALAHIHGRVSASGFRDRSIEIVFEDDPNMTSERRASMSREHDVLISPIELGSDGVWRAMVSITIRRDD